EPLQTRPRSALLRPAHRKGAKHRSTAPVQARTALLAAESLQPRPRSAPLRSAHRKGAKHRSTAPVQARTALLVAESLQPRPCSAHPEAAKRRLPMTKGEALLVAVAGLVSQAPEEKLAKSPPALERQVESRIFF